MKPVPPNEKTTLLLNKAWMPINAVTARAAFMHLYKGRISALDKNSVVFHDLETWEQKGSFFDDHPVLRSSSALWHIPTIVVVTSTFFRRPRKRRLTLYDMAKLYDFTCQYCLVRHPMRDLTVDHIHPRSKGGEDNHENRTLACKDCNSRKGSTTPYFNVNNEPVSAPKIPLLMLNTSVVREEWEPYLKQLA